jgi:hypothetical protein
VTVVSSTQSHYAGPKHSTDRSGQEPVGELRLAQAEMKEKGKRYGKGGPPSTAPAPPPPPAA